MDFKEEKHLQQSRLDQKKKTLKKRPRSSSVTLQIPGAPVSDPCFDFFLRLLKWLPGTEATPLWISRFLFSMMDFIFGGKRLKWIKSTTHKAPSIVPPPIAPHPLIPKNSADHSSREPPLPSSIKILRYSPTEPAQRSILFVHGGGWALGDHRSHRRFCEHMASRLKSHIFAVHYRRAPEHPMTTAFQDVMGAWMWLWNHPQWGINQGIKPAVCGDSAGAHLAALLSAELPGDKRPLFQTLIYPVTSCDFKGASFERFKEGFFLTRSMMEWFWKISIPPFPIEIPRISPMHHPQIDQSPPTLLALAGCDILYDQGIALSQKLKLHQVQVKTLEFPSMIHGFLNLLGFPPALQSIGKIIDNMEELFIQERFKKL